MAISRLFHVLGAAAQLPGYLAYSRAIRSVEKTQRRLLSRYLAHASQTAMGKRLSLNPNLDYESFAGKVPVTTWDDWRDDVKQQRHGEGGRLVSQACQRYEPTSGSTATRKWIPYTPQLLAEFDAAVAPWLFDLARRIPGLLTGRHYWSLSWLPDDLRTGVATTSSTNDLELLPWWKRAVMGRIMAVSSSISSLPTLEESLLGTLVSLAGCRDLSLVSVWSPTFALELLQRLADDRLEVAAILETRKAKHQAGVLRDWDGLLTPDFTRTLWPRLALVSAWNTSTSARFAARLAALLPQARFQGKGVWATEGVVTIPFAGTYPLAVNSHFYEFKDLDSDTIVPAWQLRAGQQVQPLLTTGSGFARYALNDRLLVTGLLHECPCLEFHGRLDGIDMVGEKLDCDLAEQLLTKLTSITRVDCFTLVATPGNPGAKRPRYTVLGTGVPAATSQVAKQCEILLMRAHHYRLARELGQLDPARAEVRPDALKHYYSLAGRKPGLAGARKIEPLLLLD